MLSYKSFYVKWSPTKTNKQNVKIQQMGFMCQFLLFNLRGEKETNLLQLNIFIKFQQVYQKGALNFAYKGIIKCISCPT